MELLELILENQKELKEFITSENKILRDEIKNRCDYCLNMPVVKKELENHWFHLLALWASFLLLGSGIITLGVLYFSKGKFY